MAILNFLKKPIEIEKCKILTLFPITLAMFSSYKKNGPDII